MVSLTLRLLDPLPELRTRFSAALIPGVPPGVPPPRDGNFVLVVASGGVPAGVLVSPKEWNRLFDRLEELEDAVEIWKGKYALATGRDVIADADIAEITAAKGAPSAVDPSPRELGVGQWKGKIKIADDFDDPLET